MVGAGCGLIPSKLPVLTNKKQVFGAALSGHRWNAGRSIRVAGLEMRRFEESTGSLWGKVVAASAPGSDVWAGSRVGCDLPGSYQCGEICSGDIPSPCCCCRALGRYLLYTQRKRLLVSLFILY